MSNRFLGAIVAGCILSIGAARAEDSTMKHGFIEKTHRDADGKEIKYVVFIPPNYTGEKPVPLILFLHGSGETRGVNKMPVDVGIGTYIRKHEQSFPFITIFPQSQKRTWTANSEDGKRAMAILAEVEKEYKVDPKRVYLTGLSMGGFGTWSLAAAYPDKWAAIVPICGGGSPSMAEKIKDIPCWCFHGGADPAVPVKRSRDMIEALKKAGAEPKYTEFPGVGHNSWDKAYATRELYPWLLEHKLK